MGNDGQLYSRSSIKVDTVEWWTDAFLIYMRIFTAVHSDINQDFKKK